MKERRKTGITLFIMTVFLLSFGAISVLFYKTDVSADGKALILTSPKNGKTVSTANKTVARWFKTGNLNKIPKLSRKKDHTVPKPVTLKWKLSQKKKYTFTIYVSRNADLSGARTFKTKKKFFKLYNLAGNTIYYWKVRGTYKGKKVTSSVYRFRTANTVRTIRAAGVANFRDIGGYKSSLGGYVRQGMVFRSANLDKVKKSGKKTMKYGLDLKTDLDLRKGDEGTAGTKSPVLSKYINIPGIEYGALKGARSKRQRFIKEMRVFTKQSNYPIVIHCIYGRDRTGTLAFMLNGLLGVSEKDLRRDYGLTFLSSSRGKDYKARIKKFEKTLKYMKRYKDSSQSLQYNIQAWLLDQGMTMEELDTIKSIMLSSYKPTTTQPSTDQPEPSADETQTSTTDSEQSTEVTQSTTDQTDGEIDE